MEEFQNRVNEMSHQVEKLEQKVQGIEQCFSNKNQLLDSRNNSMRNTDKRRRRTICSQNKDGKAATNGTQALMNQVGTLSNQEDKIALMPNFHAQMAREVSTELHDVDMGLNELRKGVLQRCRRMSTLEKRDIANGLTLLSAEDLMRALDIVAQENPDFQARTGEVELNINAQSESTLWRLKFFIADVYQAQFTQTDVRGDQNNKNMDNMPVKPSKHQECNSKLIKDTEVRPVKPRTKKAKKADSNL